MAKTHGMCYTPMYRKWAAIKNRCLNEKAVDFRHYGGRGITVCEEWINSFESFKEWSIQHGYSDSFDIDRIDNDKGYNPENCRYVTHKDNLNNRRNTIVIEINGVTKSILEWCKESGASRTTIYTRYKNGVTGTDIIKTPRRYKQ